MCALVNGGITDKLESFLDRNTPIRERVSSLIHRLENFNPTEGLEKIIIDVGNEEFLLFKSYKDITLEIRESLSRILCQINELRIEALKIDLFLFRKDTSYSRYFSVYSKLPPPPENKSDISYQSFLQNYERANAISHEVARLRVESLDLMEVQKIMDSVFSQGLAEMANISEQLRGIMGLYRSGTSPLLLGRYGEEFNSLAILKSMVDEKEAEFLKVEEHLKSANSEVKIIDKYDKFSGNCDSENISIGKSLFVYKSK